MGLKKEILKIIGKIAPILFLIFILIFIGLFFISLLYVLNEQETNIEVFIQNLIISSIIFILCYFAYINLEHSQNSLSNLITASNIIWVTSIGFMAAIMATVIFSFILSIFF
ncbi:MAG: hypothetical protein ACMXYB_05480 [Candidatus Woesearchaeota archaeon]